jgi:hypothetical protein
MRPPTSSDGDRYRRRYARLGYGSFFKLLAQWDFEVTEINLNIYYVIKNYELY